MIELTSFPDYERVATLRQEAWKLLEDYRRRQITELDPAVIVGLQDVANQLGNVEAKLLDNDGGSTGGSLPQPAPITTATGSSLPLSTDAEILLALAESSIPHAASQTDEAERWLRVMRGQGNVGRALRELGMPSGPLATPAYGPTQVGAHRTAVVATISADADRFAIERGAQLVSTVDVLFAVMARYGTIFDRALYAATSKSRSALLATLADGHVPQAA
jgi:hypothetical protein